MPPEDREKKPESIGYPYLGSEIVVVDKNGEPLPPGEPGEILSRSPARAGVIYPEPKRPQRLTADEWYRSGDIGYMDEGGYLYYRGRLDDALDINGEIVFASEIEAVVLSMEDIIDCAAVGVPGREGSSVVGVFAVIEPNARITEEELFSRCQNDPSLKAVVGKVFFVDQLPRNEIGKVKKHVLISEYQNAAR